MIATEAGTEGWSVCVSILKRYMYEVRFFCCGCLFKMIAVREGWSLVQCALPPHLGVKSFVWGSGAEAVDGNV